MHGKNLRDFFKGFTFHLLVLVVVGFILLIISTAGIPYIIETSNINKNNSMFFYPILMAVKPLAEIFSYILMGIGSIVYSVKKIAWIAWESSAAVSLDKIHGTVEENLSDINDKIITTSNEIETFLSGLNKPITIGECQNREDYEAFADRSSRWIYGPHISNPKSLYSFVKNRLLDPFSRLAHPSRVEKKIKLSDSCETDNYYCWKEETKHHIHHVTYGMNKSDAQYDLKYMANAFVPDLTITDWIRKFSLKVSVDNKVELESSAEPTLECNTKDEGFFCWQEGDWIFCRFYKKIVLTKEWTEIEMKESSINCSSDDNYSLNTSRPIYGYDLDITIPDIFKFDENPFISPAMSFDGLPEFCKVNPDHKKPVPAQDSANHMRIRINEWILPGIIAGLSWEKK